MLAAVPTSHSLICGLEACVLPAVVQGMEKCQNRWVNPMDLLIGEDGIRAFVCVTVT